MTGDRGQLLGVYTTGIGNPGERSVRMLADWMTDRWVEKLRP